MPDLEPGIHLCARNLLDGRVKPGHGEMKSGYLNRRGATACASSGFSGQ